jgi:ABC-type thiamine transport system ATPase subunit
VRLRNLTRSFHEGEQLHAVLQSLDATFVRGEKVALRGRSGSGISTLLNLISGIDVPDDGEVEIDGQLITAMSERVLTEIKELLDAQARNGADNLFFHINAAEYAALIGDVDLMLANLRKAMDSGLIDVGGFYTAPFNRYRGDPRFIELENESIRLANAERRKLGMLAI